MIIITHAAGSLNASRLIIPHTTNHIPPTGNNAAEEYHYINPFAYRSIDKLSKSIASPDLGEVWRGLKSTNVNRRAIGMRKYRYKKGD
jgi:hypothetical protein